MDIQTFTNFALPSKMNIQIFENFNLPPIPGQSAASKKRAAGEVSDDEPPTKRRQRRRNKMNPEKIKQGVEVLVERYQLDEVQKANLESVAELTHFVPSVEQVEWVITEARLREDCSHELNYHMFPYMEFFPWFLDDKDGVYRLSIGERNDSKRQLWIGFCVTSQHKVEEVLYTYCRQRKRFGKASNLYSRKVTWLVLLQHCFQLDKMPPEECSEEDYCRLSGREKRKLIIASRLQIKYL
jgi:hypothetical protein